MSKRTMITLAVVASMFLMVGVGGCGVAVSTLNKDKFQKNTIEAKKEELAATFDTMTKVIVQKTQITKASSQQQKELVANLVQGRAGGFVRLVHEANPESAFTREQFTDLSNAVEAHRQTFLGAQKQVLDMVRENHDLHDAVFSGMILSMGSRERVEKFQAITSGATKSVILSGEENEFELDL